MRLHLHVDVRDRRVVVVGGGRAAIEKVRRFSAAGALVTVVDPSPAAELASSDAAIVRRPFTPADLDGAWLVVAATDDATVNDEVERAAEAASVWVNRADKPDGGRLALAAVAQRGRVHIGITTGGASPALAVWLRDRIMQVVPTSVGELADLVARRSRVGTSRSHRELRFDEALAAIEAGDSAAAAELLGIHPAEPGVPE